MSEAIRAQPKQFRPKKIKIAPSMMSADFRRLSEVVRELEEAGADWLHFDIMDGRFVPNITFGALVLEWLRSESQLPFDAHLMLIETERYLKDFVSAGANIVSVHAEAVVHLHRAVEVIKNLGAKPSVAINPATPPTCIEPLLSELDMVLVMSVNPGFAGQKFLPLALPKVEQLARWREERGLAFEIEVDGGIKPDTAPLAVKAGASVLVSASGIFTANKSVFETIKELRRSISEVPGL